MLAYLWPTNVNFLSNCAAQHLQSTDDYQVTPWAGRQLATEIRLHDCATPDKKPCTHVRVPWLHVYARAEEHAVSLHAKREWRELYLVWYQKL
jgi:hypothetical protein